MRRHTRRAFKMYTTVAAIVCVGMYLYLLKNHRMSSLVAKWAAESRSRSNDSAVAFQVTVGVFVPVAVAVVAPIIPNASRFALQTKAGSQLSAPKSKEDLPYEHTLHTYNQTMAMRIPLIELDDIFISVKTALIFHKTRLQLILDTWYTLAMNQVYFFTDADDHVYSKKTFHHLINTNCSASHKRVALCCKLAVEYDAYLASKKQWFCHFDDDSYVHVANLLQLLRRYDSRDDCYLGRPSLSGPMTLRRNKSFPTQVQFWFATGGAGFCISRALALKMVPYTGGGALKSVCEKTGLPDDCTVGFIIDYYLHQKLILIDVFHSHLENLNFLSIRNIDKQITFSYSQRKTGMNVIDIGGFDKKDDPTRFRSLHCHLYPQLHGCQQMRVSTSPAA